MRRHASKTALLGVLIVGMAIAAAVGGRHGTPDALLPAVETPEKALPTWQGSTAADPAVGMALPNLALPAGNVHPSGVGAILVIVTADDDAWWATADSSLSPPRHTIILDASTESLASSYGFSETPAWLLVSADSTVVLRHVGPVERELYARWEALLGAATP